MKRMKYFVGMLSLISLVGMLVFFIHSGLAQERQTYVGVERCRPCHLSKYEAYKDRRYAGTWRVLEMLGRQRDPECIKCHVTGFGEPGGFVSAEATPHLKHKQCEACHGPGSLHARHPGNVEYRRQMAPYKYGDENICLRCHACMRTHGPGGVAF